MSGLIPIKSAPIAGEIQNAVDARRLWKVLQSKQQFGNWIDTRLEDFTENEDYTSKKIAVRGKSGAQNRTEYTLTLDTAKHIAMMERTDIGRKIRQYFIEVEKHARLAAMDQKKNTLYRSLFDEMARRKDVERQRDMYRERLESLYTEVSDEKSYPVFPRVKESCSKERRIQLIMPLDMLITGAAPDRAIRLILPMPQIVQEISNREM